MGLLTSIRDHHLIKHGKFTELIERRLKEVDHILKRTNRTLKRLINKNVLFKGEIQKAQKAIDDALEDTKILGNNLKEMWERLGKREHIGRQLFEIMKHANSVRMHFERLEDIEYLQKIHSFQSDIDRIIGTINKMFDQAHEMMKIHHDYDGLEKGLKGEVKDFRELVDEEGTLAKGIIR